MSSRFKGRPRPRKGQAVSVHWHLRKRVWSIISPKTRLVIGYSGYVLLKDADFKVYKAGRKRTLRERRRNVHAFVCGTLVALKPHGSEPIAAYWHKVRYNPYVAGYFFNAETGKKVESSERVRLERGSAFVI